MPRPPRPLLTKRRVDALKPRQGRYDVFDARLPGFMVRVHPSGRKIYRFKYLFAGRQRVETLGEHGIDFTTEAARTLAEVLRGRRAAGEDPAADRRLRRAAAAAVTVADLIIEWLRDGPAAAPNKRAKSWINDASRLNRHILPLLGSRPAASLTMSDIERAQRAIADGETAADVRTGPRGRAIITGGRAAARSSIATFSACLAWAAARGKIASNPAIGVRKIAGVKRERFLSDTEAARLMATLETLQARGRITPTFADVVRVLLLTGARRSEITNLTWDELDLERGLIRLRQLRAKNGDKVIVLNPAARAIIEARPRTGRFVFASTTNSTKAIVNVAKWWDRVRSAAGLPGLRLHDLRHSFASFAAADGASLPMIAKALGHAHTATTARYAHLADADAQRVADGVGRRLAAAQRSVNALATTATPSTSGHPTVSQSLGS
ncbi:MAG: site-specific integrase [Hyphomonadaceae bacterium]